MYYLFENNKICNIEKSKNDEENFSDEAFDKLVEQRHGKIKKRSENVFDLIEVGDLVRFSSEFMISFVEEINLINYGLKALNFGINKEYKPSAIYKPNKSGDYICVWRRENEEH